MDNESGQLSPKLSDLFETLYRRQRLGGKSCRTSEQYRCNLRHLDKYLGRPTLASDLSDDMLAGAMQHLADRGRCHVTVNKLRHHVVALWNFLARKRIVEQFPTVRPWTEHKRAPIAWTEKQLRCLFAVFPTLTGTICGLPESEWHLCHNLLLWYSAERALASLSVRVSDLDLETGWCQIRAEHRKGGQRGLSFRLPPQVLPIFQRFVERDPSREFLFPLDCVYRHVFKRYRKILKLAGLPHDSRSLYHRMRRSAISHFKRLGGNGTRFAGHSNEKLTRDCYEDPTICAEQQGSDLLFLPMPPEESDPNRAA